MVYFTFHILNDLLLKDTSGPTICHPSSESFGNSGSPASAVESVMNAKAIESLNMTSVCKDSIVI